MVMLLEVKNKVKVWYEIRETAGDRGDVNFMNVDEDIVDGGCSWRGIHGYNKSKIYLDTCIQYNTNIKQVIYNFTE